MYLLGNWTTGSNMGWGEPEICSGTEELVKTWCAPWICGYPLSDLTILNIIDHSELGLPGGVFMPVGWEGAFQEWGEWCNVPCAMMSCRRAMLCRDALVLRQPVCLQNHRVCPQTSVPVQCPWQDDMCDVWCQQCHCLGVGFPLPAKWPAAGKGPHKNGGSPSRGRGLATLLRALNWSGRRVLRSILSHACSLKAYSLYKNVILHWELGPQ